MYISGSLTTFIPRLHQLARSGSDFVNFENEGISYTGIAGFPRQQANKIMRQEAYSNLGSGWLLSQNFFTGRRYFSSDQILNWYYNLTGADNLITHGVNFSNWAVSPDSSTGFASTKTASGIIFIQSGTAEFFRYEATGLTPNTEYQVRVQVGAMSAGANGNIRLMGSGQDGANIWPVAPNNTVNFDLPVGTGNFFARVRTDTTNTGAHRLTFRHATSPDGEWFRITDANIYPIPSRSAAKVAILGDRTSSYGATNANLVARALLNPSGDNLNIVAVGDLADGSTQYAVNNDVKTGIAGYTGVSGKGGAIYPVPGNWDYSNDADLSNFNDYFGLTGTGPGNTGFMNRKVTLGYVDYFLVDSNNIKSAASVSAAQALPEGQWLLGAIGSGTSPFKIVVWHYPSHTSSSHHSQTSYTSQRWNWSGLGVQAVLSSHDHVYEKFRVSGAYYFTLGIGGGAINAFGNTQPFSVASGISYGYVKIHDSPTDLVMEYLSTGNALLDRTRITRYQA